MGAWGDDVQTPTCAEFLHYLAGVEEWLNEVTREVSVATFLSPGRVEQLRVRMCEVCDVVCDSRVQWVYDTGGKKRRVQRVLGQLRCVRDWILVSMLRDTVETTHNHDK